MCICLQAMILLASWRPKVWWDGSYDLSAGGEGKLVFEKDKWERQGGLSSLRGGELHSKSVTSWSSWSSAWGWMKNQPKS